MILEGLFEFRIFKDGFKSLTDFLFNEANGVLLVLSLVNLIRGSFEANLSKFFDGVPALLPPLVVPKVVF